MPDLGFLTPLMLCVLILYISGGTYSLKSTLNDRFFEKLFMAILFNLRAFARNLLRGNRRRNTFHISFWRLVWDSNPGFSSNKPTHYLLDHGDLNTVFFRNKLVFHFSQHFLFTILIITFFLSVSFVVTSTCVSNTRAKRIKFVKNVNDNNIRT